MTWLKGFISSERYRTSGKNKAVKEYILSFPGVDDLRKASLLVGRSIEYRRGELRIRGRIVATHGVRGGVRARFRKGLPGNLGDGRVYLQLDAELLKALRLETPSS